MGSPAPTLPLGRSAAAGGALAWVAAPVAALLVLYWPTVEALGALWASTQDYGHGFLIAPIAAFLVWRKRRALEEAPLSPAWGAGVLCLAAGAGWLVAHAVGLQVGMQLALLAAVLAALWTTLGWQRTRWLLFPVGYLIFAIPVWSVAVPPLQELTADVATRGVRWIGIPVFREGPFLTIPQGRFEIAEVCAGLRFLMASMSLAALYGYLNFDDWLRRGLFFALAVLWSVLFNWIRVVVVIWLGHALGMDAPLVQDHNSVGWVLFAVSLVPLFVLGHLLQGPSSDPGAAREPPPPGADPAPPSRGYAALAAACVALAAAGAGPAGAVYLESAAGRGPALAGLVLPDAVGGWRRVETRLDWQPVYRGADAVSVAAYAKDAARVGGRDGSELGVYVARFAAQAQDRELVSDESFPFNPERWSVLSRGTVAWPLGETPASAARLVLRGPAGRVREVQYLYAVGGRIASTPLRAKLYQLVGLLGGRTDAAVVALASDRPGGVEDGAAIGAAIVRVLLNGPAERAGHPEVRSKSRI